MQITITPTGTIERVNGQPRRVWEGTTDQGHPVRVWVAMVELRTRDAEANADFARQLQEVKAERRLSSFDIRMVVD